MMTRRLGKVGSHFICKLAIGLFQISVLLILGMAIIEVTVEADHLTGQVSFNFPVVCESVNVKSAKLLNVCLLLLPILCRAAFYCRIIAQF